MNAHEVETTNAELATQASVRIKTNELWANERVDESQMTACVFDFALHSFVRV